MTDSVGNFSKEEETMILGESSSDTQLSQQITIPERCDTKPEFAVILGKVVDAN